MYKLKLKLKTVLITLNIILVILPFVIILLFKFYRDEMFKQGEAELIAEASVLAASYSDKYREVYGLPYIDKTEGSSKYQPITPSISKYSKIYPPRPNGIQVGISDKNEELIGKALLPIIKDSQLYTLSGIKILNKDGVVIAGQDELGFSFSDLPEVQSALSGQYKCILRERISDEKFSLTSISRNGRFRLFVALPVFYKDDVIGAVYLSRTPLGEMKDFLSKIDRIFIALLFIFGVIVIISLALSNWLASPIKQLISKIDKFKNSPKEPIKNESFLINEYDELFSAFSNLSESILERTEYIKNFAYHVSHEFKSPITAINGAIEILHDHLDSMPKEKALHFIDNISQDTARLHTLTMQLLELAKADSIIKSKGECTVENLISSLERHEEDNIEYQGETKSYPISLEDLKIVLNNLIENSFQHGASKVIVNFSSQSKIYIEDNGAGISKENVDKIFTPFFTTRRDNGGTGLGLQIVISTLKQYGAKLKLDRTEQGKGTVFLIEFE